MSPALGMALLSVLKRQVGVDCLPVDLRRLHFLLALQLKARLKQFDFKDNCNGKCIANIYRRRHIWSRPSDILHELSIRRPPGRGKGTA